MEFDIEYDPCDPDAIHLLQQEEIDFVNNIIEGISSEEFMKLLFSSGLLFNRCNVWVTFHGYYDFGYLIKILTAKESPSDIDYLKE